MQFVDFKFQISDLRFQGGRELEISDCVLWISNFRFQISDFRAAEDLRSQIAFVDFKFQISDFRTEIGTILKSEI